MAAAPLRKADGGMLGRMVRDIAPRIPGLTAVEITSADGQAAASWRDVDAQGSGTRQTVQIIAGTAQRLSLEAQRMNTLSSDMSDSAGETAGQADAVSSTSEQIRLSIEAVAEGIGEVSASIQEIAASAHKAARVAHTAVEVAEAANMTVGKLGDSSAEIGEVVKVIRNIAEQTNLLALNATIEAARAGESGRGFAVVANEVKELARATSEATQDISQRIEAIQADTGSAVDAISEITSIINTINELQTTIASAVEEHTASTRTISLSVAEVADGSAGLAASIAAVGEAAFHTRSGAQESQDAAGTMSLLAADLKGLVGRFRLATPDRVSAIRPRLVDQDSDHEDFGRMVA